MSLPEQLRRAMLATRAPVAEWSPADMAGLLAWWDSDLGLEPGAAPSYWDDQTAAIRMAPTTAYNVAKYADWGASQTISTGSQYGAWFADVPGLGAVSAANGDGAMIVVGQYPVQDGGTASLNSGSLALRTAGGVATRCILPAGSATTTRQDATYCIDDPGTRVSIWGNGAITRKGIATPLNTRCLWAYSCRSAASAMGGQSARIYGAVEEDWASDVPTSALGYYQAGYAYSRTDAAKFGGLGGQMRTRAMLVLSARPSLSELRQLAAYYGVV